MTNAPALTHFAGRAGDHNDRAMVGSRHLTALLSERLGVAVDVIGAPEPALATNWDVELAAARPALDLMARRIDEILRDGRPPVTALSRCAVALATLPRIALHRPDAVVVWFDAHADLNTPETSSTGYLGGLAFSGPLGLWDSGLGAGVPLRNAVLAGVRDIDPPEVAIINRGEITLVGPGSDFAARLRAVVAGRPVYVHIDCDVLEPGIVPTDYLVPDGLSLAQFHSSMAALAESEVIGIEIGEFESDSDDERAQADAATIVRAVEPVLQRLASPDA